ncbi:MAG: hypothetical protein ABJC09_05895 [Terriglobia bacterium]
MLFPFIEKYGYAECKGQPVPPVPFGSVTNPIHVMERAHASAGGAVAEIRTLTGDERKGARTPWQTSLRIPD